MRRLLCVVLAVVAISACSETHTKMPTQFVPAPCHTDRLFGFTRVSWCAEKVDNGTDTPDATMQACAESCPATYYQLYNGDSELVDWGWE